MGHFTSLISHTNARHSVWQLMCTVTICVTLLELKTNLTTGARRHARFHCALRAHDPRVRAILSRSSVCSVFQAIDLFMFLCLQLQCVYGTPNNYQHLYQLGSHACYIGRGSMLRPSNPNSGGTLRYKEHFRAWHEHSSNFCKKYANMGRYNILKRHCGPAFSFFFLATVGSQFASEVELAYICLAKPLANSMPTLPLSTSAKLPNKQRHAPTDIGCINRSVEKCPN